VMRAAPAGAAVIKKSRRRIGLVLGTVRG
jgi:hypothetical protein